MDNPIAIDNIPPSFWMDVVSGKIEGKFDFLAVKIGLSRLRREAAKGAAQMRLASQEIVLLFRKYEDFPEAQQDLQRLLKNAGLSS